MSRCLCPFSLTSTDHVSSLLASWTWLTVSKELTTTSSVSESTHKEVNYRWKYVTQMRQQRPKSPTVTLTWHACKCKLHKLHQSFFFLLSTVFVIVLNTTGPQSIDALCPFSLTLTGISDLSVSLSVSFFLSLCLCICLYFCLSCLSISL